MKRLAFLLLLLPMAGAAQTIAPVTDEVSLQAEASRDAENDQLVAVLGITVQGSDPSALAEQVNREMEAALRLARPVKEVRARTLRYQTQPRYGRDGRIEGWQVSQDVMLESGDFAAATRLVGQLQKTLALRSLQVRLSPEARRAAEDSLITEVMKAFQARAAIVAKAAGANGYRLGSLNIGMGGGSPPPIPRMALASSAAERAPVPVEAGTSQVTVSISGSIRLTR